jgi:hypothetical protein
MLMTTETRIRKLHTTVGELIAAITDAARSVTDNERSAYYLTGFVLNRMLRPAPVAATRRTKVLPRKKSSSLPY